jgi:hypothetical protein
MKKIIASIMALGLAVSLLSGCFKLPKNVVQAIQSAKPSASSADGESAKPSGGAKESAEPGAEDSSKPDSNADAQESGAPADLAPAKNPSEGYTNYTTVKSDAMDRVSTASEESDSLGMTVAMSMMGIAMADLSLIALTVMTADPQGAEMALGMLGMTDVKITHNGDDYTVTYKDAEGGVNKQTCKYDASKDQLTSTILDPDGKVSMMFEYVNLGNGYASQYYYPADGGYQVMKCVFDKDNVAAFGTMTATNEPASILGKNGFKEDFVQNEESWLILKDGKLTVFDKGTTTTN